MPEYWNTEAERNAPRPVLTEDQREQIAALWADVLEVDLLDWLAESAEADEVPPQPLDLCSTLRVTYINETPEEAWLWSLFGTFGPVTRVWKAADSKPRLARRLAFVTFARRLDAVRARQRLDGSHEQCLVMDVDMDVDFDVDRPELDYRPDMGLECPGEGEFVVRDPPLRATVELQPVAPTATYVTIVLSTSWELKESWKRELEDTKRWVLGSTLGARVFLAYDRCEPPSQQAAVVE
ncbi:hypothetical protein PG985_010332 [Apiospora marii]|uniref:RRM domain-containing protein n=1 Tax=Apiospora marii TaxID=335849 RepID=A0ABR1RMZ2_9PEZI